MTTPRFNPSNSVEFDLARGQIALRGETGRLLVPADALLALCQAAEPEARKDFARRLGTEIGRRVAERLGAADQASPEAVVEHLGGDWALMGLGSLALESWGKALLLHVVDSPLGDAGDDVLGGAFEGALQRGFGRDAAVVRLTRDGSRVRFLVTSRSGGERVEQWLAGGSSWIEVLGRLDSQRGEA